MEKSERSKISLNLPNKKSQIAVSNSGFIALGFKFLAPDTSFSSTNVKPNRRSPVFIMIKQSIDHVSGASYLSYPHNASSPRY